MRAKPMSRRGRASVLTAGNDHGGLNVLAPLLRRWQGDERLPPAVIGTQAVRREMSARVPGLEFPAWAAGVSEPLCASASELDAHLERWLDPQDWDVVVCATSLV